jgi:hypothetical protein
VAKDYSETAFLMGSSFSPIFTQQCQYLSAVQIKINIAISSDGSKGFGQAF